MIAIKRTRDVALPIGGICHGQREERWPPAATVAFVLVSSLGLWAIIIAGLRLVFG